MYVHICWVYMCLANVYFFLIKLYIFPLKVYPHYMKMFNFYVIDRLGVTVLTVIRPEGMSFTKGFISLCNLHWFLLNSGDVIVDSSGCSLLLWCHLQLPTMSSLLNKPMWHFLFSVRKRHLPFKDAHPSVSLFQTWDWSQSWPPTEGFCHLLSH